MPDDRRPPFRGPTYDRGRDVRGDRPERPQGDRPPFGSGPRPFTPRPPTRGGDLPPAPHSVRIRNGDREVEISGAPAFVRQVLDDLPTLMGRLTGDTPARSAVSLPAPAAAVAPANGHAEATASGHAEAAANGRSSRTGRAAAAGTSPAEVEELVFGVLRTSETPLAVAAIRKRLPAAVTGQQVRRILERAEDRVRATGERPATYSLR